ncbi:cytochrome D ubiquinol oxidase subunit II [Pararhizobium polonicum]|uniref:Cytochrome D ubiquinol oxidase subunit II n=1 Tax=Pararhizobium polonicum TaxID=1612624 RepID=A0A1C7P018_9HYPH|nr:carboxymuconolactone decarboxylase family protein [Pararhizobium polonicum]OBZ94579.1 cytochrome D ubiquinol oxidase subunit II [Pararhizobium polonicum]
MSLKLSIITMAIVVAGTAHSSVSAQDQPSANLESAKSRTQQLMGGIAPKLADLTDDVLYADIWERPELSKRDRSLVTVSALIALNRPDQLRSHLIRARDNGLTEAELVETITHMAFYSGWPSAVSAVAIAKDVFAEN